MYVYLTVFLCYKLFILCSHGAEKYFRRGARLNWPLGAVSRESIRAVKKLDSLKVWSCWFQKLFSNMVACKMSRFPV